MGLDIRRPIGFFFSIIGVLLTVYGVTSAESIYEKSLGYNVNLWWGLCVLVFGCVCLILARRATSLARLAAVSPEGRAIEQREHALGLEREKPPR